MKHFLLLPASSLVASLSTSNQPTQLNQAEAKSVLNSKTYSTFLANYENADSSDKNVVLSGLGVVTPELWERKTEQIHGGRKLKKCVKKCNRHDEWNDFKGKSYEENREKYEKNKNKGRKYSKPNYLCSECVKFLPRDLIEDQLIETDVII